MYSQVALDVIEELCHELALQRLEGMNEYAIFIVTNRGTACRHLTLYINQTTDIFLCLHERV